MIWIKKERKTDEISMCRKCTKSKDYSGSETTQGNIPQRTIQRQGMQSDAVIV